MRGRFFARRAAASVSATSGRVGIICKVRARPISRFWGCRTCHPASHWLRKPRWARPSTSSADMSFILTNRSSGTLGLPSGKRSNGFWALYCSICSLVSWNTCPQIEDATTSANVTAGIGDLAMRTQKLFIYASILSVYRLCREPGCARQFLEVFLVQFDADAGLVGNHDVAFLNDLALLDKVLPTLLTIARMAPVPLDHQEVGHRRQHAGPRARANGRRLGVRRDRHVIGLCHVGVLLAFRQSTALLNVRHDDVQRLLLENLPEAPSHIDVLAGADGSVGRLPHIAHGVDVFRRHRLLQPRQAERLQFLGHTLGGAEIVPAVHVDRQFDFLRQRFAHEPYLVDHVIDLGVVRGPVHTVESGGIHRLIDIDFGHCEVVLDDLIYVGLGLRVLAVVGAAVAVDANPVAEFPSHQLIDGHIEGLAGEVPQGNFDCGQGSNVLAGLCATKDAARPDALPDALAVARDLAQQSAKKTLNKGRSAADGVDAFAVAVQALIGVDADMKTHEVRGLYIRDPQLRPLIWCAAILHGREKTLDAERSGYARAGGEKGPSVHRTHSLPP